MSTVSSVREFSGKYWAWYFNDDGTFYNANQATIQALAAFLDQVTNQYKTDFGFDLPRPNRNTDTGEWMVQVDTASQGLSGSASPSGLGLSAGTVLNDFYAKSFTTHEMSNMFAGQVTAGWPWANGSYVWSDLAAPGSVYVSPFPYACSVMILNELGYTTYANQKIVQGQNDNGFKAIYWIFQKYGWVPFQKLMQGVKNLGINLSQYSEPLKTATVIAVMSSQNGMDFISYFGSYFEKASEAIKASVYAKVQQNCPALVLTNLIAISGPALLGGYFKRKQDG